MKSNSDDESPWKVSQFMRNTIHSFWHHNPCTLQSHQRVILTQFYDSNQGQIVHKVAMNILAFEHTFSFFIPSDTLRRNDFLEIRYRMKTQSKCYNGSGRQCIKILHCWWITLKARLTRMRNEMDNSVNRFCHQRNCLTLWQRRWDCVVAAREMWRYSQSSL